MMKRITIAVSCAVMLLASAASYGQKAMTPQEYAEKYAPMAIKKMQQYRIPASITLAQGILESACGTSRLAVEGNNHFGIKCKTEWTGARIYHDDDAPDECFRKYSSVEDSYNDHSLFLTTRSRYAGLFKLDVYDYKGWAYGLKAAGYATSPTYADRLIRIIEENKLYEYDRQYKKKAAPAQPVPEKKETPAAVPEPVPVPAAPAAPAVQNDAVRTGEINGVKYIIARSGDSFTTISFKSGVSVKKLLKYNDLSAEEPLDDGTVIFLGQKKDKSGTAFSHTVKTKTTLYALSQLYGIRYKSLKSMNREDYREGILPIGAEIRLR